MITDPQHDAARGGGFIAAIMSRFTIAVITAGHFIRRPSKQDGETTGGNAGAEKKIRTPAVVLWPVRFGTSINFTAIVQ